MSRGGIGAMPKSIDLSDWMPMDKAPRDGSPILVIGLDCDGRGSYWPSIGIARWKWFPEKSQSDWDCLTVAYPDFWRNAAIEPSEISHEND